MILSTQMKATWFAIFQISNMAPAMMHMMPRLVFAWKLAPNLNFEMAVSLLILAIRPCKFQHL